VIVDLAAVLEAVDAAGADHRLGLGPEEPVADVHLVTGELGEQAARVFLVEPPVEQVLPGRVAPLGRIVAGRGRIAGAAPVAVAMPGEAREEDVAEHAGFDDALVRRLVDGVVVALVADLEQLAGAPRRRAHALAALDVPGHHLLAQHVQAGLEAGDGNLGVRPQRRRDDHRFERLLLDHLAPFGVVRGLGVATLLEHRVGQGELGRVDVGHGHHVGEGGVGAPEQHAPLATDTDVADAHGAARDRTAGERADAEAGEDGNTGDGPQEGAASGGLFFGSQVHGSSTSAAREAPNRTVRMSSVVRSTRVSGWVAQ
jgi:hypothetical protein